MKDDVIGEPSPEFMRALHRQELEQQDAERAARTARFERLIAETAPDTAPLRAQLAKLVADEPGLEDAVDSHRARAREWIAKAVTATRFERPDLADAAIDKAELCQYEAAGFARELEELRATAERIALLLEQARLER